MEVNSNDISTPSFSHDSHTVKRFTYYYGTCLLPILYLKLYTVYSMIFVELCLKLNFARIIYIVICVACQYHLIKT